MEKILKTILKKILIIIHNLIVYFMAIGFLMPDFLLSFYIITWPSVYLHWQFNNNRCILTELEYYLDNKPYPPTVDADHDYIYISKMLRDLNIKMSNDKIHYSIVYGFTIFWIIGCIRYFKYKYN
jgi:hypothetical protein